jgi:hypothetical protein
MCGYVFMCKLCSRTCIYITYIQYIICNVMYVCMLSYMRYCVVSVELLIIYYCPAERFFTGNCILNHEDLKMCLEI